MRIDISDASTENTIGRINEFWVVVLSWGGLLIREKKKTALSLKHDEESMWLSSLTLPAAAFFFLLLLHHLFHIIQQHRCYNCICAFSDQNCKDYWAWARCTRCRELVSDCTRAQSRIIWIISVTGEALNKLFLISIVHFVSLFCVLRDDSIVSFGLSKLWWYLLSWCLAPFHRSATHEAGCWDMDLHTLHLHYYCHLVFVGEVPLFVI